MATGLDLNLDGLTEEQLRAARQFQQRLGGVRAARVAGPAPAAAPLPGVVDTTAQSAARATAGPAIGSVPTATNPAPVATSAAASKLSFGSRVLGLLTRGVGAVQAGLGVKDLVEGRTGAGVENVALGAATAVNPVVGVVGNVLASGRDFVMEKIIDQIYGKNKTFLPQSAVAATPPAGGAVAARTPIDAEALINGTAVPERGTGAFRRGRAPAVAVDTRGTAAAAPAVAPAAVAAAPAPIATPRLSTSGNIFEAAAGLGGDILATAAQVGAQHRGAKAATAAAEQAAKRTELGIKAEDAVSNRIKAVAEFRKGGTEGLKVTTDFQGNPIIVDTRTQTATKPNVQTPPTAADIRATATKNKMTEAQVVQRLVAEGRLNPNSALALRYAVQ